MEDIQQKASFLVISWIKKGLYTKSEFSEMLGISRPTLNLRMEKGNWRKREIDIITEKCQS